MFLIITKKYNHNGCFVLSREDNLKDIAKDIPDTKSGVYLVYAKKDKEEELIYIGCSGKMKRDRFEHRKGGIRRRITHGHQFGKGSEYERHRIWKMKMEEENIESLIVYWYITFDEGIIEHIPAFVEATLIQEYYNIHKTLPKWNQTYP